MACNDPASINTGVIASDELDLILENDFELTATTTLEDSVLTYIPGSSNDRYPCGTFDDPDFGQTSAQLFLQFRYPVNPDIPIFEDATVDSLILHLGLANSDRVYGDSSQTFEFEVYEVLEDMENVENYYSNQVFETEAMPLGSFSVDETDFSREISVTNFFTADTVVVDTIQPQVSVELDATLAERLINLDSLARLSNTNFLEVFKGLNIRPVSSNDGMASFSFEQEASNTRISYFTGRMTLYYQRDGVPREYSWVVDPSFSTQVINYTSDLTGAPIEDAVDDPDVGNEQLYLQGYSGTNVKIAIDGWQSLSDVIVNRAELEVFARISEEDAALYPLPEQMIASELFNDQLVFVRDFSLATLPGQVIQTAGGDIEMVEEGLYKYTLNISTHFQEILDGSVNNEVFLRLFPKPYNVRRVILLGPEDPEYPMNLRLTYTQL